MKIYVSSSIIQEQHGFLPKKQTVTNLSIFTDYVASQLDHFQIDTIYTDLAKAFDKVNYVFLGKLKDMVSVNFFFVKKYFIRCIY